MGTMPNHIYFFFLLLLADELRTHTQWLFDLWNILNDSIVELEFIIIAISTEVELFKNKIA